MVTTNEYGRGGNALLLLFLLYLSEEKKTNGQVKLGP